MVMRPLVKPWRSMEQVSFVYLDDGFARQPERLSELAASSMPVHFLVPDKKIKKTKSSERCCWQWLYIFTAP